MELENREDVLPSPNFSIDILSLSNTNYESDESFDGFEQIDLNESLNREGKDDEEQELNRFIKRSSQTYYKCGFLSAETQDDSASNFENVIVPDNIYCKNDAGSSEEENVRTHLPYNHYNNSFYVYLNSLSREKHLHKYFRPCLSCKKTYCICFDLLPSCNIPVSSVDSSERLQKEEGKNKNVLARPTFSTMNSMKMNKAVETDVNITEFDGSGYEGLSSRSSKSLNDKGSFECPDFKSCRENSCRNSRTNFSSSYSERKCDFCCQTWIYEHSTHGHLDSGIDTKAFLDSLRKHDLEEDPNQFLTWAPFFGKCGSEWV